jgi:hypothetical protein
VLLPELTGGVLGAELKIGVEVIIELDPQIVLPHTLFHFTFFDIFTFHEMSISLVGAELKVIDFSFFAREVRFLDTHEYMFFAISPILVEFVIVIFEFFTRATAALSVSDFFSVLENCNIFLAILNSILSIAFGFLI